MSAEQAMHMAMIAAGPIGNNERDWLRRVETATPACAALLKPGGPADTAAKVLESTAFSATFVGFEVEESSSRLIVSFKSKTTDAKDADADGTESLRTEPMWTGAGRAMRRKVEHLQPGDSVVVHKHVETVDGSKKVRVVVHLEVLGRKPDRTGQSATSRRIESPNEAPVAEREVAATPGDSVRTTRFDALDNKAKVAFMRACRTHEPPIADPFHDEDRLDAVLVLLGKAEKGEL